MPMNGKQMAFSSPPLGESQIRDLAQNTVRPPLTSIPGLAIPAPYGGKQRQITLSVGVAAFSQAAPTRHELVDEADRALYAAKEQGRNCVVHSPVTA